MDPVRFTVPGDPVGYLRMTQAQVRLMRIPLARLRPAGLKVRDRIKKYLAYKDHAALCAKDLLFDRSPRRKIYLNAMVYFRSGKHPDPENVRKGIQDAVFENDNKVAGAVDFAYDMVNPRVEVEIKE